MEVKAGYKQTEVGVIPEEWEIRALPDVSWFQEGPGLRNWQFTSTGMKVINVTNLENGVLNLERTDRHISISEFNRMYKHFAIDAADIVMASSGNSYSKTAVVRQQDLPLVMNTSVIRFKPSKLCDYGFLWAFLNSPLFKNQIDLMITGGAQPNFGPYHLKRMNVPVPTLPEQRAIAEALGDVDGLLGGLERLIAKKRDLKQAAMQQLLTGQVRLPGFHGEWEETTLGEVGECIIGLTYKPENVVEHGLLVLRSSNIQNGRLAYEDNVYVNVEVSDNLITRTGDILICVRNGSRAFIGKCAVIDDAAAGLTFGAFMSIYRTKYWRFVAHVFQAHDIQRQIRDNIGATINQITNKDMKAFRVKLPHEDEQTAIAAVLSDMDAELAALEQRRDKTRALKQAMMQELLTGRTRLV